MTIGKSKNYILVNNSFIQNLKKKTFKINLLHYDIQYQETIQGFHSQLYYFDD